VRLHILFDKQNLNFGLIGGLKFAFTLKNNSSSILNSSSLMKDIIGFWSGFII
jgi:hypothetical protein